MTQGTVVEHDRRDGYKSFLGVLWASETLVKTWMRGQKPGRGNSIRNSLLIRNRGNLWSQQRHRGREEPDPPEGQREWLFQKEHVRRRSAFGEVGETSGEKWSWALQAEGAMPILFQLQKEAVAPNRISFLLLFIYLFIYFASLSLFSLVKMSLRCTSLCNHVTLIGN